MITLGMMPFFLEAVDIRPEYTRCPRSSVPGLQNCLTARVSSRIKCALACFIRTTFLFRDAFTRVVLSCRLLVLEVGVFTQSFRVNATGCHYVAYLCCLANYT